MVSAAPFDDLASSIGAAVQETLELGALGGSSLPLERCDPAPVFLTGWVDSHEHAKTKHQGTRPALLRNPKPQRVVSLKAWTGEEFKVVRALLALGLALLKRSL